MICSLPEADLTAYVIVKGTELSFEPTSRSLCKIDYCSFGTIIGY